MFWQQHLLSILLHLQAPSTRLCPHPSGLGQAPAEEPAPASAPLAGLERILPAAASLIIHTRVDADEEVLGCCEWRRRSQRSARFARVMGWQGQEDRAWLRAVSPLCDLHGDCSMLPGPTGYCFSRRAN